MSYECAEKFIYATHYIDFAPCAAEHLHHTIMRNDPFWVRVLYGKVEPAHDVAVRRSIKSVTQLCTAIELGDLLSQVRVVSDARLLAIASSFLREPDGIALFSSHYFCKQAGTGQVTATAVRPRSGLRELLKIARTRCALCTGGSACMACMPYIEEACLKLYTR